MAKLNSLNQKRVVKAPLLFKILRFRKYLMCKEILKTLERRIIHIPSFVYILGYANSIKFFNKAANRKQTQLRLAIEIGLRRKIKDSDLGTIDDHISTLRLLFPPSRIFIHTFFKWVE